MCHPGEAGDGVEHAPARAAEAGYLAGTAFPDDLVDAGVQLVRRPAVAEALGRGNCH